MSVRRMHTFFVWFRLLKEISTSSNLVHGEPARVIFFNKYHLMRA